MRWLWHWGPAVALMVAIFFASSRSDIPTLPGGLTDHTGHFIGYALLGMLVLRAFAKARWSGVTSLGALTAVAICSLYGITDEFHQSFVPGRTPDPIDWIADTLGAVVGVVAVLIMSRLVAGKRGTAEV